MRQFRLSILFLVIVLLLIGCNKEENISDKVDINLELRNGYVNTSKEFSSSIHSDKIMKDLGKFFIGKKSLVEEETFSTNFDLDKLENQNKFSMDYVVIKSNLDEVFVEEMEDGLVNILIVTNVKIEELEFDENGDRLSNIPVNINLVDLYRFKDGKMVEYIQYW